MKGIWNSEFSAGYAAFLDGRDAPAGASEEFVKGYEYARAEREECMSFNVSGKGGWRFRPRRMARKGKGRK